VHARAVDGKLPAVIHATQAVFFVATKEQRRTAVGAVVRHQANFAAGIAKTDQSFAEEQHAHGIRIRSWQFRRQRRASRPPAPGCLDAADASAPCSPRSCHGLTRSSARATGRTAGRMTTTSA